MLCKFRHVNNSFVVKSKEQQSTMIKYLSIKRLVPIKNQTSSQLTTKLPQDIEDVFHLPNMSLSKKLIVLMEQYLLAYSIWDMNNKKNNQFFTYMNRLNLILKSLESEHQQELVTDSKLRIYYDACKNVFSNKSNGGLILTDMFKDYRYFPKTYRMFPKEFYTPFITTFTNVKYTNKEEDTFYNPVLLIPSYTKREEDGTIVVFKPISFIKYENKIQFNEFQNSPVFNHICKLDWSSKSWKTFYDVVQSYGILTNRTTNTLPATLRAVLKNETNNKFINYEKPRTLFANTLKKLHNTFNMDLSDMTSMKLIFTSLGCENLDYLSTKDPTKKMIDDFNKYPELRFLNKSTTQYGMEAAEDLTKDNDEDDPLTEDTNNPENNNDIDTETNESNENDESENDTSSNDEENPFDEPSDNQSSSDYTDNTDTPEEEEADDPVSKVLEIVEDNTLTDYIKREQMIVGINKIIASPPSGLSSEDLKFLKVWATEWINLVSAETTKLILARLLSRPVKID